MAISGDEVREQLVAAIEAAPELPKEDREHLADVFLDRLNAGYTLVPRGTGKRPQSSKPSGRSGRRGTRWVPFALLLAFLIFVVPAAFHHQFPIFLIVLAAVFVAAKRSGLSMRYRRPLQQEGDYPC